MALRRPTRLTGVLAALVLTISACAGGDDPAAVSTTAPTPTYYADGTPYVLEGTLYIAHQAQPGFWYHADTFGTYTVAHKDEGDGGPFRLEDQRLIIFRDSKPIRNEPGLISGPNFSPHGTKLAWVTLADHDAGTLVVADVSDPAHFRVLGKLPITVRYQDDDGYNVGLDVSDLGVANYEIEDRGWRWKPGSDPVRASPPSGSDFVQPPGFSGVEATVRLSPDQLWGAWIDNRDEILVQKPGDPGSRFAMPLPNGPTELAIASWESPTTVIDFAGTVACDITTRKCKVRGELPD